MSRLLVIEPNPMLRYALAVALTPDHQAQFVNALPQAPALQNIDGIIVDAAMLRQQVLGEEIDIAGTPMRLAYRSNRVPGRNAAYEMNIRLSGLDPLPQSLESILLEVRIGGRLFKQTFAPANDIVEAFVWDGKDVYGRTMFGVQPAQVRIGYAYTPQYYATKDSFEASFNRFGSAPIFFARGGGGGGGGAVLFAGVPPRATMPPIVLWEEFEVSLGAWDALAQGLGGWTLDVHHEGRRLWVVVAGIHRSISRRSQRQ